MKTSVQIEQEILNRLIDCPGSNPSAFVQNKYSISRETVRTYFQKLADRGDIVSKGYGKGRVYFPATHSSDHANKRQLEISVKDLASRGEDVFFSEEIGPFLASRLSESNFARLRYVATECLNNSIDHSKASTVMTTIFVSDDELTLSLKDDGLGVFATIESYFKLRDVFEAAAELAKGRRTTDPAKHAGEGLFFSARIADRFMLSANGIQYTYVDAKDDWTVAKSSLPAVGSTLVFKFNLISTKSTKSVFDRYSQDYNFEKGSPRIVNPYILALPKGDLISRSEAKKILAGAELFTSIIFDFKDVESVGQGFADEVFRVFANQYPGVSIAVKNANEFIVRMIAYVETNKRG
jgi:anti-sigma regulatory factor (Ser/Thr protein kinase)